MNEPHRTIARQIAAQHLVAGDPLGWFEDLYALAGEDTAIVPWADLTPNPHLVTWLDRHMVTGSGRALVVGCGLGDDAEELARRGFETTAFDVSDSAIAWARRRHPHSDVSYVVADLFHAPAAWDARFDLVLEAYTLQVLPAGLRPEAARRVASVVSPGGTLLVIARGREPADPEGHMPWPLTMAELAAFPSAGLEELSFEDYVEHGERPVRRFRAVYRREA